MLLRKSKLIDSELTKLEGQSYMMAKQLNMIENTQFDKNVFESLKAGKQAVEANQKKMDIDEMEDIRDGIEDQMEEQERINEFFTEFAAEDQDELLDELEEMNAENALDELDELPDAAIG